MGWDRKSLRTPVILGAMVDDPVARCKYAGEDDK